MRALLFIVLAMSCPIADTGFAQNLVPNGGFDDPNNPLAGWYTDYAWTGNKNYEGNASRVSVVPREGAQSQVLRIEKFGAAGSKVESVLLPYEPGVRYRARLKVKGGEYRICFNGYRWKPGVRPNDHPSLEQLRMAYRSKAESGSSGSWETITLEIPGAKASELSLRHLSKVRFVTLFLYFIDTGFVDDVEIVRTSGPTSGGGYR